MGFTVTRTNTPTSEFTVISNSFHRDPELADAAHRVACYLLSNADSWVLTEARLAENLGRSNRTIRKALDDLEERRYLVRPTDRKGRAHNHHYVLGDQAMTETEVCQVRAELDAGKLSAESALRSAEQHAQSALRSGEVSAESALNLSAESALNKKTNLKEPTAVGRTEKPEPLPDHWAPNEAHRREALKRNLDVDAMALKFRNWAVQNNVRLRDWELRFTSWIADEKPRTQAVQTVGNAGGRLWQE